jgi:RimJ/RimL family protein N-acetyltransferase
MDVTLREVRDEDLPILFDHQADPEAARMAAYPSAARGSFDTHWARIRLEPHTVIRVVLADGIVAGNIVSWMQGGRREVGYWLGREHWGRGIATRALATFVAELAERPLFAAVAPHNTASRRVLEKCGFAWVGEEIEPPPGGGDSIAWLVFRLD